MNITSFREKHACVYQNFMYAHKNVISVPLVRSWTPHMREKQRGIHIFSQLPQKIYIGITKKKSKGDFTRYDPTKKERATQKLETALPWREFVSSLRKKDMKIDVSCSILAELPRSSALFFDDIVCMGLSCLLGCKETTVQTAASYLLRANVRYTTAAMAACFYETATPILITGENRITNTWTSEDLLYLTQKTTSPFSIAISYKETKKTNNDFATNYRTTEIRKKLEESFTTLLPIEQGALHDLCIPETYKKNEQTADDYTSQQILTAMYVLYSQMDEQREKAREILHKYTQRSFPFDGFTAEIMQENSKTSFLHEEISTISAFQDSGGYTRELEEEKSVLPEIIAKNSYLLIQRGKLTIAGTYDTLITNSESDVVIDTMYKKIYVKGEKVNAKEIHSQAMTVEILAYLLEKEGEIISNRELSASSYSKNKNDMYSKIILPLKKTTKEKVGKEFPINCHGHLHDFTLQLENGDVSIGVIKKAE